jgi:hypothetical protein
MWRLRTLSGDVSGFSTVIISLGSNRKYSAPSGTRQANVVYFVFVQSLEYGSLPARSGASRRGQNQSVGSVRLEQADARDSKHTWEGG